MKKILATIVFVIFTFVTVPCFANPFLTCNPYAATELQPTEFVVVLNGTTYTVPASKDTNGLAYLSFDVAGKWATGTNSVKAAARNMWGDSTYTVPLVFNAGAPAVPSGVKLQ